MSTREILKGPRFEIRAWVEGGECPVVEFLEELKADPKSDYERLMYLLMRTANEGVLRNTQQIRPLHKDIYEFKGAKTSRILFFYDKGKLIICSHGFSGKRGHGKRDVQEQIRKASRIKDAYFKEKGEVWPRKD
jgi:hypothetical protein